ncbi:MAG: rod shape-determining protein MreD [Elusimicrobia bacterium RIFOXYA1_FULL_47_7]|nr:MAG: rod shape-determining protein MreD [Elusimicrobia bacterium RIFOXYA1_FULL_47_7]
MKRISGYLILFFAGLVIQFGWSQYLSYKGLSPNFLLIILIFIGMFRGSLTAQLLGFMWGLSWDVVSVDLFGSHALLLTAVGFLSGKLNRKCDEDKVVNQIIITFAASVAFWFGLFCLYFIFGQGEYKFRLNSIIFFQPFYNMLVAPAIFWLGERLLDIFDVRKEEEEY